jgi:glucosamine--fructose-6-phosphate aminotransferase (isomerizing)
MCGIVGVIARTTAAPLLLEGLKRLEYRGYDSAGVATIVNGHIDRRRATGKLINLERLLASDPIEGTTGIGHTRWATHGAPTENNAHPHATEKVAVVHNGIIENHQVLRAELIAQGCNFATDTDTEVVAHLMTVALRRGLAPSAAMGETLARLEGAFALAIVVAGHPELLFAARRGSPLALGLGDDDTMYVGSDAMALAPFTQRVIYLEDGDWAEIRADGPLIRDSSGAVVTRAPRQLALSGALIGKGNHRHFMHKEIHEQPVAIGDSLSAYLNPATGEALLPALPVDLATMSRLTMVACGTSFHAAMIARYWLEGLARLPVDLDIASEYRYRNPVPAQNGLALFISQSGETIDTLSALRFAKSLGVKTAALVNVPESQMSREADATLRTFAGPEIGVASTKAFTTQLAALAALTLAAARARGTQAPAELARLATALVEVPARIAEVLAHDEKIREIAEQVAEARDVLYLGRGTSFPVALEGALKLKEISYIHAEGYAAGEMKHGPIALIDEAVPVIMLAPPDAWFEKTASNVEEVAARGGKIILIGDRRAIDRLGSKAFATIAMPDADPFVQPILYSVPVQLLAYHAAVVKGTDVDQPRNLAKAVTVE